MQATVVPRAGARFHLHVKSNDDGLDVAFIAGGYSMIIEIFFEPLRRLINMLAQAWNNIMRMLTGQWAETI
jgi:hypothetical protein